MEIHMIGHASLFIRTSNLSILMDPVLWDPHQEGLFDINPKREVLHDKIPPVNLIILSHRHLDHFDIRSLASLPKHAPVLIPKDQLLENYLRKLGFAKIQQLKDFTEVTIGKTTLFTTRSENNVPEYGIIFKDESGVFWNQVDSVVSPKTVETVLSRFPQLDFVLASWQPMLETNFQTNGGLPFPYARYGEVLYNLGLASPRALAPGANAFCFTRSAAWMNHVVFPVSKARFLHDVRSITVVGRLKNGMALRQAQAEFDSLNQRIEQQYHSNIGRKVTLYSVHERLVTNIRPLLLLLQVAVAFILLIACANIANLLIAWAGIRHQELAVRMAHGASRPRIVRQLFTDARSCLLPAARLDCFWPPRPPGRSWPLYPPTRFPKPPVSLWT